jgi:hypothetical protein
MVLPDLSGFLGNQPSMRMIGKLLASPFAIL